MKQAVEQLSRYLADSNAAAIDYFETAAPHLRILFDEHEFEHFAGLVESYAFSEAYEELMAAAAGNDLVQMPEMDGYQAAGETRSDPPIRKLPDHCDDGPRHDRGTARVFRRGHQR